MSVKKKPKGIFEDARTYTTSTSGSASSLKVEDLLKARESLFYISTKQQFFWDTWSDPIEKFNTEYLADWRYTDYIKPNDYVFGHPTYRRIKAAHYFDILAYRKSLNKPIQVINASTGASIELAEKVLVTTQTLVASQKACRYICL